MATAILMDLELGGDAGIRLLTNNPDKVRAVEGPNREVIVKERVAMVPLAWKTGGKKGINSAEVEGYLETKVWPCQSLTPTKLIETFSDPQNGAYAGIGYIGSTSISYKRINAQRRSSGMKRRLLKASASETENFD